MKCENCNNEHDGNYGSGRFCNTLCARSFSSSKQPKKDKSVCLTCGLETKTRKNKFCSNECHYTYRWNKRKILIKESNGLDTRLFPHHLKKFLIEDRGHKCEICETEEWMEQPVPLVMDHINGRAADNRLDNLRLVCGNCDMQLPTFKSKNKNSDRKKRVSKIL
jgi:hypothetical protein